MFDKIKLWLKKKEWRKRNGHNETSIVNAFNFAQVSVGKGTYGGISAILMADDSCIKIGNYCSIGPKVVFMGGGEHDYKRISTYPFQSKVYKQVFYFHHPVVQQFQQFFHRDFQENQQKKI